jgi:hypothetical protein
MTALAEHIHSRGLKFGLYTDRGDKTCDNHVGSFGYEAADAATYASWGSDFIKSDSCDTTQSHAQALDLYAKMAAGIAAAGRPQFFSLCGWLSWYPAAASLRDVGDSWRIGPDALRWENVLMNFDAAAMAAPYVSAGHYADVDEIMGPSRGRPISRPQTLTQIALATVVGSPLLISFDVTAMEPTDPDIAPFLNPEVITGVHQDPAATGPRYARLVGGPVGRDRIPPVTNLPCDDTDARTGWQFQSTTNASTGYLRSLGALGWCLSAGAAWYGECNNAQGLWLTPCGKAGLCCDASCSNQEFTAHPEDGGSLRSVYWPANNNAAGPYVTLDLGTDVLFLEERFNASGAGDPLTDPARQAWAVDTSDGRTFLRSTGTGTCVGAVPRDDKGVWGRQLTDGSWAVLLMNVNETATQNVTCDGGCLARMGFGASQSLAVRDLWARSDNGSVSGSTGGLSVRLLSNGTSAFVRLTPRKAEAASGSNALMAMAGARPSDGGAVVLVRRVGG